MAEIILPNFGIKGCEGNSNGITINGEGGAGFNGDITRCIDENNDQIAYTVMNYSNLNDTINTIYSVKGSQLPSYFEIANITASVSGISMAIGSDYAIFSLDSNLFKNSISFQFDLTGKGLSFNEIEKTGSIPEYIIGNTNLSIFSQNSFLTTHPTPPQGISSPGTSALFASALLVLGAKKVCNSSKGKLENLLK